jgi:hypothetical protein
LLRKKILKMETVFSQTIHLGKVKGTVRTFCTPL